MQCTTAIYNAEHTGFLSRHDGMASDAVVVQNAAAALFPAAAVDAGGRRTLQRTDFTIALAAEARPDVHGDQQQHWPSLPTQGLRPAHSLPQGSQPSQTRQVGHQSAHRLSPSGAFLLCFDCSVLIMPLCV